MSMRLHSNVRPYAMALDNFAFVLLRPKSPGNIGASARALKNMGMRDLRIVTEKGIEPAMDEMEEPNRYDSDDGARAMAVHGRDVLADATIHPGLESALADRTLVVGTTARAG